MSSCCFDVSALTQQGLQHFYAPSSNPAAGLNTVLGHLAPDTATWQNIPQVAYALATFKWETANTFAPIHELGSFSYFDKYEPGTPLGTQLGNTQKGDGFLYRGRGYVQITGRELYQHVGQLLGVDLLNNPDLALDPEVAYRIAAGGMLHGWFTGRRLSQYFSDPTKPDYVKARRMINGTDHAEDIAAIAQQFAVVLQAATPPTTDALAAAAKATTLPMPG